MGFTYLPYPLPASGRGSEGVRYSPSPCPIYGWFTEGFDTPDLAEAKTLLAELELE